MPAVSLPEAKSKHLALHVSDEGVGGKYKTYCLYDAINFVLKINDGYDIANSLEEHILAVVIVSKPGKAYKTSEVENSAAEKGYGPLLYDIVMNLEGGLIPDRDGVSSSARSVWDKYFNRSDIEHKPLDDIEDPWTPSYIDDATLIQDDPWPRSTAVLDQAYFLNDYPSVSALFLNDKKAIEEIQKLSKSINVDNMFNNMALAFFEFRYP